MIKLTFNNLLNICYHILKFLCLSYYIISLSFRLSFDKFHFNFSFLFLIILDYLTDIIFIIDYIYYIITNYISDNVIVPIDNVTESAEILSVDFMKSTRRNSASSLGDFYVSENPKLFNSRFIYEIISLFPFEIIGYFTGYKYYPWLRLNRLFRLFSANKYWTDILHSLELSGFSIKSGWARIALSCIFQTIFSHVIACAYYLLAVETMKDGQPKTWLSHDGNAVLGENNEIIFKHTTGYIYIRALYFAVQTLETVGYGDICAYNLRETIFCIILFYCALFTLQITIANIVLLITSQDESRNKYSDRSSKLAKYAQFRSLSKKLVDQCQAFYKHQHSIMRGVDEHRFVEDLPSSLQNRILKTVIREMLAHVESLSSVPDYFLSTLATEVQTELYFPSEIIVSAGSPATGLYIVSRGIVVKMSSDIPVTKSSRSLLKPSLKLKLLQTLNEGDYFGDRSLYIEGEVYLLSYQSRSFCEILYLSSTSFKRQCQLHLTKFERESLEKYLKDLEFQNHPHNRIENDMNERDSTSDKNSQNGLELVPKQLSEPNNFNALDNHENGNNNENENGNNNNNNNNDNDNDNDNNVSNEEIDATITSKLSKIVPDIGPLPKIPVQFGETGGESDSESTQGANTFISKKHRRVALQPGISIKFEETNYLTTWFHPDTKLMIVWRILVALCVLYYMFSTPLLLSVSLDDNIVEQNEVLFGIAYFSDFIMIINLLMSLFVFPFFRDGIIRSRSDEIYEHYCKHHYLILDILALIPYDLLGLYFGANLIPVLRLPRLYIVLQTNRYLQDLKGFSESINKGQLLVLIWWLYMLIHWYGSLFVLSARISTRVFHYDTNWIITDRYSSDYAFDHNDYHHLTLYFRSIYWALYSASSIGYWDILATNPVETFSVTVILLYGCQMLIGLLGSISSEMQSLTSDRILFQSKLENAKSLALRKGLNREIRDKLAGYFQYNWDRCRGVDETQVFNSLPLPLRQAVIKEITGAVLKKIVFFQECSDGILNAILASLQPRIFIDGDAIVTAGEFGTDFFVIESGCVHVTSADRSIIFIVLGPGNYLGESCLMGLQVTRRTASAYSQGYSYTYALRNIDFSTAIAPYPEEGKAIIRKIKQILDLKMSRNAHSSAPTRANSALSIESTQYSALTLDPKLFYHPDSFKRQLWGFLLLLIFIYNMILIPWRFALYIDSIYYIIDYLLDIILFLNLYFIYCKFYTLNKGIYVIDEPGLKQLFFKENFSYGYIACIPFDIITIFFISQPNSYISWCMKICRLGKLFLLFDVSIYANCAHILLERLHAPYMANLVIRMILTICLIGHWAACGFYVLPYWYNRNSDDINTKYIGTWVDFQIDTDKLPPSGGDQWTRYLRALNWAIPTLTLEVLDDIFAVNNPEMMYCFFAMFFGIMLNATIIGTMISLLQRDIESADVQIVRQLLESRNVDVNLRLRVIQHLNFLGSSAGQILLDEENIIKQLPFSLQVAIIENTKLPLLNKCPLFDSCSEESKRNLCLAFRQQIYSDGDLIIKCGDIGQEMYFLVEGSVDICNDTGVSFTILQSGSYFGETGLVFSDRRMSNVKAIGICVCYCLERVYLDNELKASSEEDAQSAFTSLQKLLASNQKRNAAVSKNLSLAKDKNTKLSKMIIFDDHKKENQFLVALKDPHSKFCLIWDIFGLLTLIYYAISIPFHFAFLHGIHLIEYRPYLTIDFFIDLYWIMDIYLRYYYFTSLHNTGQYESEELKEKNHYKKSNRFIIDCISSLPLEIFALIPKTHLIFVHFLRFIHLIRVSYILKQITLVHLHLDYLDLRIRSSIAMIIKSFTLYIFGNHWIGCGFFMLHRYCERHNSVTWAIKDGLASFDHNSGVHSVCDVDISYCYLRSIYFVLSTLTSVGYGDVAPYNNIEFCYEIFVVALSGACLNALVCGSFGQYWFSVDSSSMLFFKKRMEVIDQFVNYRKLDSTLRDSLIGQFEYVWMLERQTGGYETNFLTRLPPSLAAEVALVLRSDIVKLVPIFKLLHPGRIALALRPQIFFKNSTIFSRGDISEDIYFVRKGSIRIKLSQVSKYDNTRAMYLQRNKMNFLRGQFYKGSHFGEMCLLSPISLHISTAIADVNSEIYTLSKVELWKIFLFIPRTEQRIFLIKLLTEVNGIQHSPFSEEMLNSVRLIGRTVTSTLDNLYELSDSVLNEIIDEGIRRGSINETIKQTEDVFFRIMSKDDRLNSEIICPWFEVLRAYEQKKLDMILTSNANNTQSNDKNKNNQIINQNPTIEIKSSQYQKHKFEKRSVSTVSEDLRIRIKSLFQFMDMDGSGAVSREELMTSLQSLGWKSVTWDYVDILMSSIRREDEKVYYDDLVEVICDEYEKQSQMFNYDNDSDNNNNDDDGVHK